MDELEGMEKVYLPSVGPYAKPVHWCSKKVTFKDYFEKYSEKLNEIQPNSNTSTKDIMCNLLGIPGSEISDAKFKSLSRAMDPKKFFSSIPLDDLVEVKHTPSDVNVSITSKNKNLLKSELADANIRAGGAAKNKPAKISGSGEKNISIAANESVTKGSDSNQLMTKNGKGVMRGESSNKNNPGEKAFPNLDDVLSQPSTSKDCPQTLSLSKNVRPKKVTTRKAKTFSPKKTLTSGQRKKSVENAQSNKTNKKTPSVSVENSDLAIATFDPSSSDYTDMDDAEDKSGPDTMTLRLPLGDINLSSSSGGSNKVLNLTAPTPPNDPSLRRSARVKVKTELKNPCNEKTKEPPVQISSSDEEPYQQRSASEIVHEITRKAGRHNRKNLTVRGQILLDTTLKLGKRDLHPRKNFVVTFRIHKPYRHGIGQKGLRPAKCLQEIDVLNFQTLGDLRAKIVCEQDYQDTRGNVSNWPYAPITLLSKDKYKAGMFYIGNTFYIDTREGALDYSIGIRKWAEDHFIDIGETKPMNDIKVEDLKVRLGYPYVYMHQGCCEHVIIISQARLLTEKHSLHSSDYPNITKTSRSALCYCAICCKKAAKWIVMGSDRMPQDISFMCPGCFQSYHYKDTKKIGNFKAYRWNQRGLLYH